MARGGARVLAALAPAVLLAVDPWGWYPFGPIKWLLTLTLALAGAASVLHELPPRVPRSLAVALAAFLGWLVLAAALGDDPLYGWIGTPERHLGALTWALCGLLLVVGTALDDRAGRVLVDGLLVAGVGVGAVATAEALGWEPSVLDVAPRLSGSLGSPAYLGAATALLLPIALSVALTPLTPHTPHANSWENAHRNDVLLPRVRGAGAALGWVASGLLVVACLGSGARAAWVGLAAAALVTVAARSGGVLAAARARPRRAAGAVAAAVVVGVLVVVLSPVGSRVAEATDPDSAGGRGRFDEWRIAARVVADHPIVGLGPEAYRTAFASEVDARYERAHGRRQQPDRAHSGPLDLALAGGLPLVAGWLAVVAIVGRRAWWALRSGAAWQRGVAAALVAHVTGQLLLFPVVELEPVAWLLAGVLVGTTTATSGISVRRRLRVGPVRDVVPTVLAVLAVAGLLAGVTDVVADHRAERAVDALARGDSRAAAAAADSAAGLRPDIVRLHLLAARTAVADEQGTLEGLRRVDDALAVSPRDPIARLQRVTLLVQRAEATQTAAHLAAARAAVAAGLREDPFAAALWRLRARLALVEGDAELAREAGAHADDLTPPHERP